MATAAITSNEQPYRLRRPDLTSRVGRHRGAPGDEDILPRRRTRRSGSSAPCRGAGDRITVIASTFPIGRSYVLSSGSTVRRPVSDRPKQDSIDYLVTRVGHEVDNATLVIRQYTHEGRSMSNPPIAVGHDLSRRPKRRASIDRMPHRGVLLTTPSPRQTERAPAPSLRVRAPARVDLCPSRPPTYIS